MPRSPRRSDGWLVAVTLGVAALPCAAQYAELVASDGVMYADFGWAVSLSGDRALVGAHGPASTSGAAYVFELQPSGAWLEVAKLVPADGGTGDRFGIAVALDGDRAIVGADRHDLSAAEPFAGAAYVFERDPTGAWIQSAKLVSSSPAPSTAHDAFGRAVDLSGERAAVAYPGSSGGADPPGRLGVFERQPSGAWVEVASVDMGQVGGAGNFLALDGERALVGAATDSEVAFAAGAAFVVERQLDGTWTIAAKLLATDGAYADGFGTSGALFGSRAAVGAPMADDGLHPQSGAVYILERQPSGAWVQAQKLTAIDAAPDRHFGRSVGLSAERLLVGSPYLYDGGAYAHVLPLPGSWELLAKIKPFDGVATDTFGSSADVDGMRLLVGEPQANAYKGAAYVFGAGPPSTLPYGCINPEHSLFHVSGAPTPGGSLVLSVHNPVQTQTPGGPAILAAATAPAPAFPCGIALPGMGMQHYFGGAGELQIDVSAPNPVLVPGTGPWLGNPKLFTIAIPGDAVLLGARVYFQGAIFDPIGPLKIGLTRGVEIRIGQ